MLNARSCDDSRWFLVSICSYSIPNPTVANTKSCLMCFGSMKYRSMYNSINQKLKAFPGETIVCLQILTIANKSRVFPFYIDVLLLVEDNNQQYSYIAGMWEESVLIDFFLLPVIIYAPALVMFVHDRTLLRNSPSTRRRIATIWATSCFPVLPKRPKRSQTIRNYIIRVGPFK